MNFIRGLITKDLLQLKSYRKTLIVFMIIFICTSVSEQMQERIGNSIIVMITLGFGMFSMATFNYDEMAKADRYILTFPVTKKEIVISKYILIILSTIIGSVAGIIISLITTLIISHEVPNIMDLVSIAFGSIFGIGVVESIQIPCIYKSGAEKGRIQMFILTILVALLMGGICFLAEKINFNILKIQELNKLLPIILLIINLGMYFVSYKVSYKIFQNKEI